MFNQYRKNLTSIPGIILPEEQPDVTPNYAYYPIIIEDKFGSTRDEVFEALKKAGILSRKYFYPLISDFECYRNQFDSTKTPNAAYISSRVLTLPMYSELPEEAVLLICETLKKCRK